MKISRNSLPDELAIFCFGIALVLLVVNIRFNPESISWDVMFFLEALGSLVLAVLVASGIAKIIQSPYSLSRRGLLWCLAVVVVMLFLNLRSRPSASTDGSVISAFSVKRGFPFRYQHLREPVSVKEESFEWSDLHRWSRTRWLVTHVHWLMANILLMLAVGFGIPLIRQKYRDDNTEDH